MKCSEQEDEKRWQKWIIPLRGGIGMISGLMGAREGSFFGNSAGWCRITPAGLGGCGF